MKIISTSLATFFFLLFFAGRPAFAQNSEDFSNAERESARLYPDYFTINAASIRTTLLEVAEEPDMSYVRLQGTPRDLNGILVSIEKIVNIATKLWKIVEANQPVVGIDMKYATAYPEGITSASQLSGWNKPKAYTYGFYAENMFGTVMIDVKYKAAFTYNGNYKNKGKYLTAVTVIPTVIEVGWGYKFYMSASVPDSTVTNVGTSADPLAAMQLKLNWKMATVLKEVDGASVYYVRGDGFFEEIASPFKVKKQDPAALRSAAPLSTPEKVF